MTATPFPCMESIEKYEIQEKQKIAEVHRRQSAPFGQMERFRHNRAKQRRPKLLYLRLSDWCDSQVSELERTFVSLVTVAVPIELAQINHRDGNTGLHSLHASRVP